MHDFIAAFDTGEYVTDGIIEDIGEYVVPPVAAISAAEQSDIGVGIVHDDVPAVVAVEVVLHHLHVVVSVLVGFVDTYQPGTEQCGQGVEALVKLAIVVVGALAAVVDGGIHTKRGLVYVAA